MDGYASAKQHSSDERETADGKCDEVPVDLRQRPAVIIKRRRLPGSTEASALDLTEAAAQPRVPKVFRTVAPIDRVGRPDPAQPSNGSSDQPSNGGPPSAVDPAAAFDVDTVARRRRRVLNGRVRVVYTAPINTDVAPDTAPADAARRAPDTVGNGDSAFDFGSLKLGERYRSLMARIAELEHQAMQLRKAEAVRWIRGAIARYGLSSTDIGL